MRALQLLLLLLVFSLLLFACLSLLTSVVMPRATFVSHFCQLLFVASSLCRLVFACLCLITIERTLNVSSFVRSFYGTNLSSHKAKEMRSEKWVSCGCGCGRWRSETAESLCLSPAFPLN